MQAPYRKSSRIVFLDVVRAFAILMMLQGHFVDTMLDPAYRNQEHWLYYSWAFMRGITAPVFFFSSGLVFTFLLVRKQKHWTVNERINKGINRGLQLIALGYILRLSLPAFFFDQTIYQWVWGVDVLHCIGIALLVLIGLYILHQEFQLSLIWLYGLAAFGVFFYEPVVEAANWTHVPDFLANYFVKQGYSTFTIFPWIGYSLIGGVGGILLARRPQVADSWWLPVVLLVAGLLFHYYSIESLITLYQYTGVDGFISWRIHNSHLLIRLGDVWVVMAIIIWITRLWKNMPGLVPRIGAETLTIYGVHYVVLFGTWFGVGIHHLGAKSWSPWAAGIGAILFLFSFVVMIHHIDSIRAWMQARMWGPLAHRYRRTIIRFRIWLRNA